MSKTIFVTEDHIEQGTPEDIDKCPIALAVDRDDVEVTRDRILVADELIPDLALDPEIVSWIDAFDNGESVDPIRIKLDPKNGIAHYYGELSQD